MTTTRSASSATASSTASAANLVGVAGAVPSRGPRRRWWSPPGWSR